MGAVHVHPALRGRVARIDVVRAVDTATRVLPGAGAVLGLQLQGRVSAEHGLLTPVGVTGIQERVRRYSYMGDTISILVRFTPQGATCLGAPGSALSGSNVGLDDLLPAARVRALREEVLGSRSQLEQIERLQQFLLALPFEEDRVITRAVAAFDGDGERRARVRDVARQVGLSERQLERRFLSRVGIGPRRYASLRRFERALALAATTPALAQVAYLAGYADQSHLVREVRRLTDSTPTEILGRG